jgi:beta-phosphoglucomutase
MLNRKKPDPEIYLKGLKKIKIRPEECFVVEDSQKGLQAATPAGIRTIGTTT